MCIPNLDNVLNIIKYINFHITRMCIPNLDNVLNIIKYINFHITSLYTNENKNSKQHMKLVKLRQKETFI